MTRKKKTSGGTVEYLRARYVGDDPAAKAMLELERVNARVAEDIYNLRTKAGLSQRALAELVGTSASVICQLENTEYLGHSLTMLTRIASALGRRVEISFPPEHKPKKKPAKKLQRA